MTHMPSSRSLVSGREMFSAFVSDDHAINALYQICSEFGWSCDVVYPGGLHNAVQTLAVSSSPSILFVDISQAQNPLSDINSLAEVCEPGTIVIACGHLNDVRLYRDLLASGIQDYLLMPLNPDQLRDAFAHAQALLNQPKPETMSDQSPVALGVLGVRGGCGATSFATGLAWSLAAQEGRLTALLDLDLHFGTGALQLDLEPGRGLTDAIENPARIDGLFLERSMVKASDRLSILSAEASLTQPVISDGTGFMVLQQEVISAFECTVVDLPRSLALYQPNLLAMLTHIILVSETTLASARDCYRMLGWLKAVAPQAQVQIVLNKVSSAAGNEISRSDFEASIERKVDFTLPDDPKSARQAAKLGKALSAANPTSRLAVAFNSFASELMLAELNQGDKNSPASTGKKGWANGWFSLRGLSEKLSRRANSPGNDLPPNSAL